MRRTDAQRRKARALRFRHSQSLAGRRHRFNQAMVAERPEKKPAPAAPGGGGMGDMDF